MAFYNEEKDDEETMQGQPVTQGPQATTLEGQGVTASPGQGTSAAQSPNPSKNTPDRPGNFIGIKDYLNANKTQASKLGDQAANVIGQSATQARNSLGGLTQAFNTQAEAQKVADDPTAYDALKGGAEKLTQAQKDLIKKQANAQYAGPQSLTNLGDQYTKASTDLARAQQNINMSGTEEGRQGIIKQINNDPRTAGMTNFDSLLLQSGGGRQKLAEVSDANKELKDDLLGKADQEAIKKADEIKSANDLFKNRARQEILGQQSGLYNQLNKAAADRTANEYQQYQDILGRFKNNDLREQDLSFLGINPAAITKTILGNDLSSKVIGNELGADLGGRYNAGNIAKDNEKARYAALQDLATGFSDPTKSLEFSDYIGDEDAYNIRNKDLQSGAAGYKNYTVNDETLNNIGKKLGLKADGIGKIAAAGLTEDALKRQLAEFKNGRPVASGSGLNASISRYAQKRYDAISQLLDLTKKQKAASALATKLNKEDRARLTNKK